MTSPVERVVMRLEQLRDELFDAIDYSIKMDGHHKSYEGEFSIVWPHRFNSEFTVKLSCYVIGPQRHYYWEGESLELIMDDVEKDVRAWIKEDKESWEDA